VDSYYYHITNDNAIPQENSVNASPVQDHWRGTQQNKYEKKIVFKKGNNLILVWKFKNINTIYTLQYILYTQNVMLWVAKDYIV
jgi:hypothetical protein